MFLSNKIKIYFLNINTEIYCRSSISDVISESVHIEPDPPTLIPRTGTVPVSRYLIVGERPLELVDAEEEVLADLGHGAYLQLFDDVTDVGDAAGVAEALLIEEGNLVVEHVKLVEEGGLGDGHLEDGAHQLLRHDHVVDELAQFATHRLSIFQPRI
jgi:hypothetical protein